MFPCFSWCVLTARVLLHGFSRDSVLLKMGHMWILRLFAHESMQRCLCHARVKTHSSGHRLNSCSMYTVQIHHLDELSLFGCQMCHSSYSSLHTSTQKIRFTDTCETTRKRQLPPAHSTTCQSLVYWFMALNISGAPFAQCGFSSAGSALERDGCGRCQLLTSNRSSFLSSYCATASFFVAAVEDGDRSLQCAEIR